MKSALRYGGLGLFMVGLTFMPIPVTDPKAVTSVFPWIAWSGAVMRYGAWMMAAGVVLFALSFAWRSREY